MQIKQASVGERRFYESIKDAEVRAIRSNTDKGDGWRPVCRGRYLGSACVPTEQQAISEGKIFLSELKRRVEGEQEAPRKRVAKTTRKPKEKAQ